MRPLRAAVAILLTLAFLLAPSERVAAQEQESLLDRILNPMPAYDPFDKPPPPPQFFPDEVDRRAHVTLMDSLTANGKALEQDARFFREKDDELRAERGRGTGLTQKVRDLYLAQTGDRNDELVEAEELMRKSFTNRFGAIFNRLLSSVDLVSIVSGSYIGAAVDSAMTQLFTAGLPTMSIEERKALALYLNYLKRYPESTQAGPIRQQVEALEKRKQRALVQQRLEKAEKAMENGDLSQASFHYEMAGLIDPDSKEVKGRLEQLREQIRQREKEREKALSISSEDSRAGAATAEGDEVKELLQALALREPGRIETEAKALEERSRGQPLADAARDALAVAAEIRGEHDQAKRILSDIARSSSDLHQRERAKILLASPEYNLLASLDKARSEHRLQTVKYVLLGEDLLKKNLIYGTGPLLVAGPAGATSLAAANLLIIGSNLFQALTSNPVSPQPIIDKAVAYVRSHPHSESATEVYTILGEAYENAGKYDQALHYYEMSGKASATKLADLKEKAAQSLLQGAEKSGDRTTSELYLKAVLDQYPESPAAKVAMQRVAQSVKTENQGFRLSKKFLLEHPDLYGPHGLRLKPALFDGDTGNMELADRGINLVSENEILLHFQTPWGVQSQSYPLSKEDSDRFLSTLRRLRYENPEKLKDVPLPLLQDQLVKKERGPHTRDTTFNLVREAKTPSGDFPKVLDHELLSENEKHPGALFKLPPIQGNISPSRFDLSGSLPAGFWGNRIMVGTDEKSPFAGIQLPIPLLQGFIPVDFMLQARPGRFALFPKIHQYKDKGDDQELYR